MSLFDIFKPAPAPAPTPAAPAPASTPGAAAPTPAPAPAPADPLAGLGAIWETPVGADGKPIQVANPLDALQQAPITADPAKISEAIGKLDFTKGITPDMVTKIQTGTPEEASANLAMLVNSAVRQAVTGITLSQSELVNTALARQRDAFTAALPTMLKKQALQDSQSDDPVLSHPAVQPLITAMKQSVFSKNPNLSAAEVEKKVNDYFRGLGAALGNTDAKKKDQDKSNETQDWDSWLDGF